MKEHGLRGSYFESCINKTLDFYRKKQLAVIQKIPTPIIPVEIDKKTRHITLGYFDKKSTVDYIGVVQDIPVCFDAKECQIDRFNMQNIHIHQYEFLKDFEEQGGISFILIYFIKRNEVLYVPFSKLKLFYERKEAQKKMSFNYTELDEKYIIKVKSTLKISFLEKLQMDIDDRW